MTKSKAAPAKPQRAALLCPQERERTKRQSGNSLRCNLPPQLADAVLAQVRLAYESSAEPLLAVAARHGLTRPMLTTMATAQGWRLRRDQPRKRIAAARAVERRTSAASATDSAAAANGPRRTSVKRAATPDVADQPSASAPRPPPKRTTIPALAKRLERALAREIDRIERAHESGEATAGRRARATDDARVVRTLTSLTETLFKVKQLRAQNVAAQPDKHDDDIHDFDQFRIALAKRIEALVEDPADAAVCVQPRSENGEVAAS